MKVSPVCNKCEFVLLSPENTSSGKDKDDDISSDPLDSDEQLERFEEQLTGAKHSQNALDLECKPVDTETVNKNMGNTVTSEACVNLSSINPQMESRSCDPSNGYSNFSFKDKAKYPLEDGPSLFKLELSGVSGIRTTLHGECNVFGHSGMSAFSK